MMLTIYTIHTMLRRIAPLEDTLSSFVRASQTIGSFHTAVEEVILNSIDAGCQTINIIVDLEHFSFEVSDDGNGIDSINLETNVAEWNRTSKQNNMLHELRRESTGDSTYGMKGEALACLRQLSDLTVQSRLKSSAEHPSQSAVFVKSMCHNSLGVFHSIQATEIQNLFEQWNIVTNTRVSVIDLFHNLPVRRKAMKPEAEISHLKEFIQHMSVLHHSISWTLTTCTLLSTATQYSSNRSNTANMPHPSQTPCTLNAHRTPDVVLLRLPSQASVAKRFVTLHGAEHMLNMQHVSHTSGDFTLQGFLTPPLPQCCTKHREGQYMYLNSCWLRGSDSVSNAVNGIYNRVLTAVSGGNLGGMVARHASYNALPTSNSDYDMYTSQDTLNTSNSTSAINNSSTTTGNYPCFVLHLTCPSDCYDILSEPDKSVALFANEVRALHCVEEAVSSMIREYYTDRVDALLPLVPVNAVVRAAMVSSVGATSRNASGVSGASGSGENGGVESIGHNNRTSVNSDDDMLTAPRRETLYSIANTNSDASSTVYAPVHSPPAVHTTTALHTASTYSPYFTHPRNATLQTTNYTNNNNTQPLVRINSHPTNNTSSSTIIQSPQSALFSSAFFSSTPTCTTTNTTNNATTTNNSANTINASASTAVLNASQLFRDSPYSPLPYTRNRITNTTATTMLTNTSTNAMNAATTNLYVNSPYSHPHTSTTNGSATYTDNTNNTHLTNHHTKSNAVHLQYRGVKRMVSSIADNTTNNSSTHTNSHDTNNVGHMYSKRLRYDPEGGVGSDMSSSVDVENDVVSGVESGSNTSGDVIDSQGSSAEGSAEHVYECDISGNSSTDNVNDVPSPEPPLPLSPPMSPLPLHTHDYAYTEPAEPIVTSPLLDSNLYHYSNNTSTSVEGVVYSGMKGGDIRGGDDNRGIDGSNIMTDITYADQDQDQDQEVQSEVEEIVAPAVSHTLINTTATAATSTTTSVGGYVQHTLHRAGGSTADHSNSTTTDATSATNPTSTVTSNSTLPFTAHLTTTSTSTLPLPGVLRTSSVEVQLNKAQLQAHLQSLGQCDRRYILATSCCCTHTATTLPIANPVTNAATPRCPACASRSMLLVLDQHAVDERIQVEALTSAVSQAREEWLSGDASSGLVDSYSGMNTGASNTTHSFTTTTCSETLPLLPRDLHTLQTRHQALTDWGFQHTTHTAHNPNAHDYSQNTTGNTNATLHLHTVPVIAGEPLHASDLREFLHYISTHTELPTSLLAPPVVQRIVSSRACHRAVRFGDFLDHNRCAELCTRLMCTALPFQCAHGRPSMVPLLDLRALQAHKRRELLDERKHRMWN